MQTEGGLLRTFWPAKKDIGDKETDNYFKREELSSPLFSGTKVIISKKPRVKSWLRGW